MYAIEAENLSRSYKVYPRPFDRLKEAVLRRPFHQKVEALSEVSFQAGQGETIGIIGENGAGKSTLLKILAGTLRPSSGSVVKRGRVAALLELGSGFHPEFTGRQNIYLNAALLGLQEEEIQERESGMISFSELEEAIDRPVKTYSSGMYVRLGFSIATSADPDILIVDEALSVGDQRFQQKCVDRMMGFREAGKTILVCSHSMYLINELCSRSIWLNNGRMNGSGKTSRVIGQYLAYLEEKTSRAGPYSRDQAPGRTDSSFMPDVLIEGIGLLDEEGNPLDRAVQFGPLIIQVSTRRAGPPFKGHLAVGILQPGGEPVFETTTKMDDQPPISFSERQMVELRIPSLPIQGRYEVRARVGDEHGLRLIDERMGAPFVIESDRPEIGVLWMAHEWRIPDVA